MQGWNIKDNNTMKILTNIKDWLHRKELKNSIDNCKYAFSYDIADGKAYILCNGIAIMSMPTSVAIDELMEKFASFKETAVSYEISKKSMKCNG